MSYEIQSHPEFENAIVAEHEGRIALLTIYDKEDASTVRLKVIKQMARELGFEA